MPLGCCEEEVDLDGKGVAQWVGIAQCACCSMEACRACTRRPVGRHCHCEPGSKGANWTGGDRFNGNQRGECTRRGHTSFNDLRWKRSNIQDNDRTCIIANRRCKRWIRTFRLLRGKARTKWKCECRLGAATSRWLHATRCKSSLFRGATKFCGKCVCLFTNCTDCAEQRTCRFHAIACNVAEKISSSTLWSSALAAHRVRTE